MLYATSGRRGKRGPQPPSPPGSLPRYPEYFCVRSKHAGTVSQAILHHFLVKIFGCPQTFYTDQGAEFTATLIRNLWNELGVWVRFAHMENHKANPVERFHQTLYSLVKSLRQEGEARL